MDALNGMRPPSAGNVFLNNLDFYANLNALKQNIGYVPQDDRLHRELTVYRTLYYVARLRLSRDASLKEIAENINDVLEVTGLTERRNVPIADLSGGQRKRVSIAVELITKPSVIFLDEPTSGLDPAAEDRIMKLFRRIAESGRTIVLTTHAMENVRLFDKIVVLMSGKLVFYGTPNESLKYLQASNFKELYDRLETPIEQRLSAVSVSSQIELKKQREQITEETAEHWKQKFIQTEQFRRNVFEPLKQLEQTQNAPVKPPKRRLGVFGAIRQTLTLAQRYAQVLWQDKLNLIILFLQAPIIALMTFSVVNTTAPRDFVYFILSLVAVWFGTSLAAREIVRERAVFKRERMVNLSLLPYLTSKLLVLGLIVALQCMLLFVPLKFLDFVGLFKMPGELFGLPQLLTIFLTAFVGVALGLLISALVKTSEMATSLVPLVLIPQILFSGFVGVPHGAAKIDSLMMPTARSFDSIKRLSGLDTLETEGSDLNGPNNGLGLYKAVEEKNDEIIKEIKDEVDEYKHDMRDYLADINQGIKSPEPKLPEIKSAEKLPENKSDYVNFMHPWMFKGINEIVLLAMFLGLVVITIFILRSGDTR
jgi:ABC-type multidrug transport system ATPase subunit